MESLLFIGGYLLQSASSLLLLVKLDRTKSTYGLSCTTQLCFLFATLSRCVWELDTRLMDTHICFLELYSSILIQTYVVFRLWRLRYTDTARRGQHYAYVKFPALFLAAAALALAVHPGKKFWSMQILVAFTIYLESMSLMPQILLMYQLVEIESLASHVVAMVAFSRFCRLLFWIYLYRLGENFMCLLLADLVHTVLSLDYAVVWYRKMRDGGRLVYKL
ncbi:MAG: hypothetical protein KVP17_001028 [Porospora cf. gigantea B]|uniref:uncharacterized protein n=1 Tax=Porospora cf. gigantea B TaxID=2853592 RepID=UPI003571A08D|nr:MAG: hypothetical protein KVP17_001028 [Porospora cf. gigantea B]